MSVWGSPALSKDSYVRSLQTNWHIYTGQRRDTDLGLEAVFPCQNTIATLGQHSLATLSTLFPDLCIALPCSTHMNLCIPTTALELCASCFLQPFPGRANRYSLASHWSADTACCGIWLTVKNNVLKCQHSYNIGPDSGFHKGWVILLTLVEYFIVKQQDQTVDHSSAVLKTMKIVPCL